VSTPVAGVLSRDGLPLPARYYAAAVIVMSMTMSSLDGTIMNLALPGIARAMGSSAAHSIWIVSAYQLAALTLLLPLAAMGDRIGYRQVYLVGIIVFTAASAMCVTARSLPMLVGARALQGAGAAGIMAVNGALLRLTYPRHLFGRGVAINSATIAAASAAGPSVAAAVLSVASWPWLFAINLPLGVVVITLGMHVLPRNTAGSPAGERVTAQDVMLNMAVFGLVLLGLQSLGSDAGGILTVRTLAGPLMLIGAGLAVGVVYVRRQRRMTMPLLAIDLLRMPIFRLSLCTSVTSFVSQTMAYVALPFLLLDIWRCSPGEAGLLMSAWPLTVVIAAALAGRLIGRYPGGLLGGIGLAVMAVGLGLLAALPVHPSLTGIAWRMAMCGAGFGLFQSPNNHTILTSAPAHRSGAAGGMLATARLIGQTVGGALLMLVFSIAPPRDGHGPTLAIAAAACFAAAASVISSLRLRHSLVPL
jgi:DHA2 family multidrug resistance protein-like MFS transporter